MRIVRLAALLAALPLTLLFAAPAAYSQATTPITATTVDAGNGPVTGNLCLKAVDRYGNPITVTKAGGGIFLAGRPFCGSLVAGALTSSLSVPSSATDSVPGHGYDITVFDPTYETATDIGIACDTSSSTWSLDNYVAPASAPTPVAFTYTVGSGAPPSSCAAPSFYGVTGSGALYQCISGVFVEVVGASGGVSVAGDIGGTAGTPKVVGVQGVPVSSAAPTTGQVLVYNGTNYAPATPASTVTIASTTALLQGDGSGNAVASNAAKVESTLGTQAPGAVLAGPASGSAANPAFRALQPNDLPAGTVNSLPAISSLLFDYQMPATDSSLAYFKDYSGIDGSTVGVGNCVFISGRTPSYLAQGGASFTSGQGCDIPAAANTLETFVAMVQPVVYVYGDQLNYATVLGGSSAKPFLDLTNGATPDTYSIGTITAGTYSSSLDSTSGLTCAGFVLAYGSGNDALYINGHPVGSYLNVGGTAGMSAGNWELGTSYLTGAQAYYIGKMYRAAGWSGKLTAGQVEQACQVLREDATNKGAIDPSLTPNTSQTPVLTASGDSIQYGTGGGTPPASLLVGVPAMTVNIDAIPGSLVDDMASQVNTVQAAQCSTVAMNYDLMESGTNNLTQGESPAATWADNVRYAKLLRNAWANKGCRGLLGIQTITSRVQIDTGNPLYAASITLTAGGTGWTAAPTITVTGCTVAPTVVGSESGGTVNALALVTFGSGCTAPVVNFSGSGTGAAATITVSGAGNGSRDPYNAIVRSQALSSGFDFIVDVAADPVMGANFAFLNGTYFTAGDLTHPTLAGEQRMANAYSAALLAIMNSSVQATTITAATYSMAISDTNLLTAPTAAQALTLPDCTGQSGTVYTINNPQSTYAVTITGHSTAQPIDGLTSAITIPSNSTIFLTDTPVAANTSGCYWVY